jgi:hypothetical protein
MSGRVEAGQYKARPGAPEKQKRRAVVALNVHVAINKDRRLVSADQVINACDSLIFGLFLFRFILRHIGFLGLSV